MNRLKSRQHQVPGGFKFRQPEIRWDSTKVLGLHPSFETLITAVISARNAHPHHKAEHNWSVDRAEVGNEVEAFNVKICLSMGWTNYLAESGGSAPPPPFQNLSPADQKQISAAAAKSKKLWSGIVTTRDWKDSGDPPVSSEQSASRALTCSQCPQNKKGDWTSWFTVPAVSVLKKYMEWIHDQKLSTPHDEVIQVCEVCLCPLHYKVHTPTKFIKANTAPEVLDELRDKGKDCWVVKELAKS